MGLAPARTVLPGSRVPVFSVVATSYPRTAARPPTLIPTSAPTVDRTTAIATSAARFAERKTMELPVPFTCGEASFCVNVEYTGAARDVDAEVKAAIQRVVPSTVFIKGHGGDKSWSGSGVILDPNALFPGHAFPPGVYAVLTNRHVANGADDLVVTLPNGDEIKAEPLKSLVGGKPVMDEVVDAAILLIKSNVALPVATLGNAATLEQGDTILTAGHPLGLPKVTVTKGIVSNPAQETGGDVLAIQADAPINPGNSGGPMFNLKGEVVGLNTFTFKGAEDLTFAIPTNLQISVLDKIFRTGSFPRGDLGFELAEFPQKERRLKGFPLTDDNGRLLYGAKVKYVRATSPLRGKIKPDDVITRIQTADGRSLDLNFTNPYQGTRILAFIHSLPAGSEVLLTIYHRDVAFGKTTYAPEMLPVRVADLMPEVRVASDELGVTVEEGSPGQLVITDVTEGSPAATATIEPGRWAVVGVLSGKLSALPLVPESLDELKDIFIALHARGATTATLLLEDVTKPGTRKTFALKWEDADALVAQAFAAMQRGLQKAANG